jgi:hypothetical protein
MALSSFDHRLGKQINQLKLELSRQICKVRRKNIMDEFIDKEGIIAIEAGEVVHVRKCNPVIVQYRPTKKCYKELPVTYQNRSYFLENFSKIIKEDGVEKPCSAILTSQFRIGIKWFKEYAQHLMETKTPHALSSMPDVHFDYQFYEKNAEVSILADEQRKKLRHVERVHLAQEAVNQGIIHSYMGALPLSGSYIQLKEDVHYKNHFDKIEANIERKLDEYWQNSTTFSLIGDFGKIMFFLAGVYSIWVFFSFIFGFIRNISRIVNIQGCSWNLLSACSSTSTTDIVRKHELQVKEEQLMHEMEFKMRETLHKAKQTEFSKVNEKK